MKLADFSSKATLAEEIGDATRAAAARQVKWDRRFLALASTAASWSKDGSGVGSCIVRPDNTVASLGFNGFPRGMADDPELYANRERKLERMVHAEANAILNAHGPVAGYTLYCTLLPCSNCALLVIQAGIVRVVSRLPSDPAQAARWADSFERTKNFFAEAGVPALLYPHE